MADFNASFQFLMDSEDSRRTWADVPDSGGYAIAGINSRFFPVQYEAIKAIPQAQRGPSVSAFYRKYFWNEWLDTLTSTEIAKRVFDSAVNQGSQTAVKLLQLAVSVSYSHLYADGLWGPKTLATVNAAPSDALVQAFKNERIDAYQRIGGTNLKAWIARANR